MRVFTQLKSDRLKPFQTSVFTSNEHKTPIVVNIERHEGTRPHPFSFLLQRPHTELATQLPIEKVR